MTVDLIFWVAALFGTGLLLTSFIFGEVFEGVAGFFHGASQLSGTVIRELAQLNAAFKTITGYSLEDLLAKVTSRPAETTGDGSLMVRK